MALKIRLRKQGRTNGPFYRLVVMDIRTKRDGKYLEMLGWYNPRAPKEELLLSMKADRVQHWLDQGAELSDNVEKLVAKAAPTVWDKLKARRTERRTKLLAKRRERRKGAESQAVAAAKPQAAAKPKAKAPAKAKA